MAAVVSFGWPLGTALPSLFPLSGRPSISSLVGGVRQPFFSQARKANEIANTRRVLACVWLPCACSFGCGSSASLGVTRATTTNERRRQGQPPTQGKRGRPPPTTMKGDQHRKERAAHQPHRRQGFAPASPLPLRGDLVSPPCGSGHSHFPLGGGFPCPPWGGGLPFPPLGTAFSSLFRKATYPVDLAQKCLGSWQRQSFYDWFN